MQTSNVRMSIDMSRFGFSFNVPTNIEQVSDMFHSIDTESESESESEEYFLGGRGKRALLADLDVFVSCEDDYFAEDTLRQVEEPERWGFFLNTCVAYACLSSYLADGALPLELDF